MDPPSIGSTIQICYDWDIFAACDAFHLNGPGVILIGEDMIATCQWKEGKLNGEFLLSRNYSVIGLYELRDNVVINSKNLDNCAFEIVDLSFEGNRWEGVTLEGKPCGYGEYYNSQNVLTYKGIMIDDQYMCYGIHYFEDTGNVSYEGMYYNGKRWGKGIQYDRLGSTVFCGVWIADQQTSNVLYAKRSDQLSSVHTQLERITIDIIYGNIESRLSISNYFGHLEYLTFGPNSLLSVSHLQIGYLIKLKSVKFGESSFNSLNLSYPILKSNGNDKNKNRRLYIHHCPELQSILFGRESFYPANIFIIKRENSIVL